MPSSADDRLAGERILGTGNIVGRWASNSGRRSFAISERRLMVGEKQKVSINKAEAGINK